LPLIDELLNTDMSQALPFSGVTSDSRKVKEGFLFAALPGSTLDGGKFVDDAINHGARYILVQTGTIKSDAMPDNIHLLEHANPRYAFAKIVAKFYKLQPENIVAVTGTSGKTSTVSFVQQLWHLSGIVSCASLGTLGVRGPGIRRYGALTTPDTENLHAEVADLASSGITHLAMEASSHGLDQYRLDGMNIKAAAYTNLSRDHLDYHKDMDEYFEAKARLFAEVMSDNSVAVINTDDDYAPRLSAICSKANHNVVGYGYGAQEIKLLERNPTPHGQNIRISIGGEVFELTLPLVGEFQVMNALCALGLVLALDNDAQKYVPLLARLRGVAGRLQLIAGHPNAAVYVDYAHKPAALETVLKTLRPHTKNKLVCLFGCGGNRDAGKREMMGKIAHDLADKVIVTDDNPRHENPDSIRAQILKAVPSAQEIGDRTKAIQSAVKELQDGDVLVVAGKGHETGQIVGEVVHDFDDVEEVKKAIDKITVKKA
jgi:UDP-N-acetylmuramoyl-L-alanyl-D-glutamate--2,6-diaminopimelate ligase